MKRQPRIETIVTLPGMDSDCPAQRKVIRNEIPERVPVYEPSIESTTTGARSPFYRRPRYVQQTHF